MTDPRADEHLTTADLAGATPAATATADRDVAAEPPIQEQAPSQDSDAQLTPLFPADRGDGYRDHWRTVQTNFVDDPRKAVEEADGLVAQVIKELASSFAEERSKLEGQWGQGGDVSTEDLRLALQRYRSFFERLLSV